MAAGERIGFPAFMKPAVGEGMSASLSQGLLSGELHNASQLELAARRILESNTTADKWARIDGLLSNSEGRVCILERFLRGPEIFVETVVRAGEPIALSLRASKMPRHGATELPAEWHWPAQLSAAQQQQCKAAARTAVHALRLQNGVYGIQLVLDANLGCVFLEINLRPHNWPMLFHASVQLFFQPDLWLYPVVALVIALGGDPTPYMWLNSPAPLTMAARCYGEVRESICGELWFPEWVMAYHSKRRAEPENATCIIRVHEAPRDRADSQPAPVEPESERRILSRLRTEERLLVAEMRDAERAFT